MSKTFLLTAVLTLGLVPSQAESAGDAPAVNAESAFELLKQLQGEWDVKIGSPEGQTAEINYRVTASGHTLMETNFPGTDQEMVSMYFLDGQELRMTHYCIIGNQPQMKLNVAQSTANRLVFEFVGGTSLDPQKDPHVHGGSILFLDDDRVQTEWDYYHLGKKEGSHKLLLHRKPQEVSY